MNLGYINPLAGTGHEEQIKVLKENFECEKFYTEEGEGARPREILDRLLNDIKEGDSICMYTIKSLPLSTLELIELIEDICQNKKVEIKTMDGDIRWMDFSILADFNRNFRRDRAMVGLTSAKARGRSGGRKEGLSDDAKKKADAASKLYMAQTAIDDIMKTLNFKSRATLYRYLRFTGVKI